MRNAWQVIRCAIRGFVLSKVGRWPPARVAALQARRLRSLAGWAVFRSPYFREKYRGIYSGAALELSRLPTCTKQELMDNFDTAVTDPRVRRAEVEQFLADPANLGKFYLERYSVSHTSGSQGRPMLLLQDRFALETLFSILIARGSAFSRPSLAEGIRRLSEPARLAIVTHHRGFYPSGAAFEFMPGMVGRLVRVARLAASEPDLIDRLNAFRPHALVAYAGVLEALADSSGLRLSPHLRQVASTSEQLTVRGRQRIASRFGVPVLDHYGTGECLFLAEGCPTDPGCHLNSDWTVVEVVDRELNPVPPGQPGWKVLVTNLANRVQPIIRYEVDDVVRMAVEPCRCGSRLPRIERIEGRSADLLWVGREGAYRMISGAVLQDAADHLTEIREWRAVQSERNRIDVTLEPLPGAPLDEGTASRRYTEQLRLQGFPEEVQVCVRLCESLRPDTNTGKVRRVTSLVGRPAAF
jgi:phenylacetate-CoA ligase